MTISIKALSSKKNPYKDQSVDLERQRFKLHVH